MYYGPFFVHIISECFTETIVVLWFLAGKIEQYRIV
jgi:hypothetical protein